MIAVVYLFPVFACLFLHFGLDYKGVWTSYLYVFLAGEAAVGLSHYFFYRSYVRCQEYLGSFVTSVNHEDAWTEVVRVHETRTDSKGRTYTVTRKQYHRHQEQYYFFTSLGTRLSTNRDFFFYVKNLWNVSKRVDVWSGSHIKGGVRYGQHYEFDDLDDSGQSNPQNWVPITEIGRYVNKIKRSNSIFKYEKISSAEARELGLHDYPKVSQYDAPCILWGQFEFDVEADEMFRKFNAVFAPAAQMRLYILLFDEKRSISVSELQRAYWQGGNKNEMVICIGLSPERKVTWARAFSWSDEQTLEVEAAAWLMKNGDLDWEAFHEWLVEHVGEWKRKEFSDFKYIYVTLPLWRVLLIMAISVIENICALQIVTGALW